MPKPFKIIEELLSKARGDSRVPLNYVIGTDFPPDDGADNPGYNYTSKVSEMIARVPIVLEIGVGYEQMEPFHDIFQVDQKKVYYILFTIFRATEYWVYSKTSRKEKWGCKLFLALYVHHLVPNKVDHLSASFTRKLCNLDYHGENNNWDF